MLKGSKLQVWITWASTSCFYCVFVNTFFRCRDKFDRNFLKIFWKNQQRFSTKSKEYSNFPYVQLVIFIVSLFTNLHIFTKNKKFSKQQCIAEFHQKNARVWIGIPFQAHMLIKTRDIWGEVVGTCLDVSPNCWPFVEVFFSKNGYLFEIFEIFLPRPPPTSLFIVSLLTNVPKFSKMISKWSTGLHWESPTFFGKRRLVEVISSQKILLPRGKGQQGGDISLRLHCERPTFFEEWWFLSTIFQSYPENVCGGFVNTKWRKLLFCL